MFEFLSTKKATAAAVLLSGGLILTACGSKSEGVGRVPLVNCAPHGTPRSNQEVISEVPTNTVIQLGHKVVVDNNGDTEKGDFQVTSKGGGNFSVELHSGNDSSDKNKDATIVPNKTYGPDSVTVSDNGETFVVTGQPGPEDSTQLTVAATCS